MYSEGIKKMTCVCIGCAYGLDAVCSECKLKNIIEKEISGENSR